MIDNGQLFAQDQLRKKRGGRTIPIACTGSSGEETPSRLVSGIMSILVFVGRKTNIADRTKFLPYAALDHVKRQVHNAWTVEDDLFVNFSEAVL